MRSSYLQSQRFPSHVLEQSRGRGERALRAFLQSQGDACWVPTQQVHQIFQLPAHLEDKNSNDEGFFFRPYAGIPVTQTAEIMG